MGEAGSQQRPGMVTRLLRQVLLRVWYVQSPAVILVRAAPLDCLQVLINAARPSTRRLHLRDLYVDGRRYHIQIDDNRFRLMTTSKVPWRYRKRTSSAAVLNGRLDTLHDDITRIYLRARVRPGSLLAAMIVPTFMASIIVFVPWSPAIIGAALLALYGLAWTGHRYTARLEAHEMVWFVQKALDDLAPAELSPLSAGGPDVIDTGQGFEEAWRKFYEERRH
jgi:hypothetical protein